MNSHGAAQIEWKLWQMQWSVCMRGQRVKWCSVSKCDPKSFWICVCARGAAHRNVMVDSTPCTCRRVAQHAVSILASSSSSSSSQRSMWTRKVNQLKCIRLNADCHWIYCVLKCLNWLAFSVEIPLLTQPTQAMKWNVCARTQMLA